MISPCSLENMLVWIFFYTLFFRLTRFGHLTAFFREESRAALYFMAKKHDTRGISARCIFVISGWRFFFVRHDVREHTKTEKSDFGLKSTCAG